MTFLSKAQFALPASKVLVVADYLARDWLVEHAAAATPMWPDRVWLCDLGADFTDPTQRRILLALLRDGAIRLCRCDLVGACPPDKVAASELKDMGATFHFIIPRAFEFSTPTD